MIKSLMQYTTLALLIISSPAAAETGFSPWNADVNVADENIASIAPDQRAATYRRGNSVYGAGQGGAYFLIRFFQVVISPQDGPNCRFNPTCSSYGRKAVERFGAIIGSILAGDRLIRCNPYNPPGDDPVPASLRDR
jgi:putative membrane protein insertion efficiency factor